MEVVSDVLRNKVRAEIWVTVVSWVIVCGWVVV
jgi:hypothetical protein